MDREDWLAANRAAVVQRLAWLNDQPDGTIFFEPSGSHVVVVDKIESQIRLSLANSTSNLLQSRFDLKDPLDLASLYTQAVLLGLAWNDQPDRVYLVGLGGGRLHLVLHHHRPELIVECAEIDPVVIKAATRFFGVQPDARLKVACQDGRDYLAQQDKYSRYDLIFIDAFCTGDDTPYHLSTREFYQLCRFHLTATGVVITNLFYQDSLYAKKIKTIQSVFRHTYLWARGRGNGVVIATDGPLLTWSDLLDRARSLQEYYRFSFPLVQRASEVKMALEFNYHVPNLAQARVLVD